MATISTTPTITGNSKSKPKSKVKNDIDSLLQETNKVPQKEEKEPVIIIRDPRIVNFYRLRPHIDIEQVNLGMIEILERAERQSTSFSSGQTAAQDDATMRAKILAELQDYRAQTDQTLSQVAALRDSVAALVDGTSRSELSLNNSLAKIKDDYVREVGLVVANNSLSANEKMGAIIDRNASHLADRTAVLLAEQVPKNGVCIKTHFQDLSASILEQINKHTRTDAAIPEFLAAFDQKYAAILQSALTQTELRINGTLDQVKSDTLKSVVGQAQLSASVDDFLLKYGNSSTKGKLGEANLSSVLTKMYPSAEVLNTSGTPNSGDFRLTRGDGKPSVMIETKTYIQNVDNFEIQKFIRDAETQNTHAVFISQTSGISYKNNFQIDIDGGRRILVYIHNCQYSPDIIKSALDIIDSLSPKLVSLADAGSNQLVVPIDVMNAINVEYNLFLSQKEAIATLIREFGKKVSRHIDELRFISLDKYLSSQYASSKPAHYSCENCGTFHAKSKQSLSAHKRVCK